MGLLWFIMGALFALAAVGVDMGLRLNRFRRQSCTSCKQRVARRLVETLDFDTGVTRRGVLCGACANYSDHIPTPPWAA